MRAGRETLKFIFELAACETHGGFDHIHREQLQAIRMSLLDAMNRKLLITEKTRILRKFYSEAPDICLTIGSNVENLVEQDTTALSHGLHCFKQRSFDAVSSERIARRKRPHLRCA